MLPLPRRSSLFPYTTLFRSLVLFGLCDVQIVDSDASDHVPVVGHLEPLRANGVGLGQQDHVGAKRFEVAYNRSEEHTSELQSHHDLVCRLLLEKKKEKETTPRRHADQRATAIHPPSAPLPPRSPAPQTSAAARRPALAHAADLVLALHTSPATT